MPQAEPLPARLPRHSRADSKAGSQLCSGPSSARASFPGTAHNAPVSSPRVLGPLEAVAMNSQNPSPFFPTFNSVAGAGAAAIQGAEDAAGEQQGGHNTSACHLISLDLGCNPLMGDVGVCKLAAGLATHCRSVGLRYFCCKSGSGTCAFTWKYLCACAPAHYQPCYNFQCRRCTHSLRSYDV